MIKYSDIKFYFEKSLKKDFGVEIYKNQSWIYNEYQVTITMKKSNKDFLKITCQSYKTYDIHEEYMYLILYVGFLELYRIFSDTLFIMEYKINYIPSNEVLSYTCQRTSKLKFINKSDLVQAMKDLITLTEMEQYVIR